MKQLFRRISLKRRLWVSFVMLTVVCISVTGAYVSVFFASEMKTQAATTSQNTLNKTAQVFDERLRNIVVSISTLMMGEPFQRTMRDVQAGNGADYYNRLSQLQTPFAQMMLAEQSIDSVLIHTPIGEFYPTENWRVGEMPFQDTTVAKAIGDYEGRPWNTIWVRGHSDELFSRGREVISLVIKPLFDTLLSGVYVVVNIREDHLLDLIKANLQEGSLKQKLIDRGGTGIFSSTETEGGQARPLQDYIGSSDRGHFEYETASDGVYLVNYAGLGMNPDWVLIGYQSKKQLLAPVAQMRWTILTIMGVCVLLALVLSSMLSELLLKPLFKLRNLMFKVEQSKLDVRFESPFEDEISQVGYKFNRMMDQIGELIEEVKTSEQEKRYSEIKALQAQIDPHFLYNTLNTIYWKSEMEEQQDVSEMIVSLSLLFRLGLNNGKEITTLRQELNHVEQYLKLQTMCYPELFTYEFHCEDEGLLEVPVLKIMLQPLVENSILHAFQELDRPGRLDITAAANGGMLTLAVADNGSGMSPEVLERLRAGMDGGGSSGGYALSNIRARLSLYYGHLADMQLESSPGEGTTVKLVIPMQEVRES
jgi:two-component system sensor histidine kinase YesM